MQAFQNLIAKEKINIDYLTTHEFDFNNATAAFDLVVSRSEPFIGIALKYDIEKHTSKERIFVNRADKLGKINISFIGAGSYAQGNLLPNIPNYPEVVRLGVLTNSGTSSKRVSEKFNFQFCTSEEKDIFDDKTNTVFIATRHDSHGSYVIKSLNANKNVFVEKPLCLSESELENILEAYSKSTNAVMVGFNRRFSPLTSKLKKAIGNNPMTMIFRVNAGTISKDSWIQDMQIGGGRILGEVCHFIDYLTYINGSLPVKISASAIPDVNNLNDTLNVLIKFENGSSGVIAYYSNGSKSMEKEYIEVFSAGVSAVINDFKELNIYDKGKRKRTRLFNQNKGQKEMVNSFISSLLNDGTSPISFQEIIAVTKASFKILESLKKRR